MNTAKPHTPVLLEPFLENGFPEDGTVFVDGTFGLGGHSRALLEKFPGIRRIIGLDRDSDILRRSLEMWDDPRLTRVHSRFSRLGDVLTECGIDRVDGILLDLGVSSVQLDSAGRGFSFQREGPLDMRMDTTSDLTAEKVIDRYDEKELTRIFRAYGEERFAGRIAAAIKRARQAGELQDTLDLAGVVKAAIPGRLVAISKIHPATRVFQALRIAVNDELAELQEGLETAISLLAPHGRISVISFHSLEDRIVKECFAHEAKPCRCSPKMPRCICQAVPRLQVVTRRPIVADSREIAGNPRARSAKMRVAERLP